MVLPIELRHGERSILGFRIGDVAYLTDIKAVPEATTQNLQGLCLLAVIGLLDRTHPTHFSTDEATRFAERTLLSHLTHGRTHAEFLERLPDGVEPAYDGLEVVF